MITLGPIVGLVTASSARILIETDRASTVFAELFSGSQKLRDIRIETPAHRPLAFTLRDLLPDQSYELRFVPITRAGETMPAPHAARFQTFTSPQKLVALSCSKQSAPVAASASLWPKLAQRCEAGDVDLVLHIGDQIYADPVFNEWKASLQGRTAAELDAARPLIRDSYRLLYRRAWSAPAVARVLASCSNLMLWDDHEVADDWGDKDSFAQEGSPDRLIAECAWQVYREYQRQLWDTALSPVQAEIAGEPHWSHPSDTLPAHEGFAHDWPGLGVLFLDVRGGRGFARFDRFRKRSHRDFRSDAEKSHYLGQAQWHDIEQTLSGLDVPTLLVVTPVPLLSFPNISFEDKLAADDAVGCWGYRANSFEQDRVLRALWGWKRAGNDRQLLLLGGDIHLGAKVRITDPSGAFFADEVITSPMHRVEERAYTRYAVDSLLRADPRNRRSPKRSDSGFSWQASAPVIRRRNYATIDVRPGTIVSELVVAPTTSQSDTVGRRVASVARRALDLRKLKWRPT